MQAAAQAPGPREGERCFPKDHMCCVTDVRASARQAGQHVPPSAAPTLGSLERSWARPPRQLLGASRHTLGGSLRVCCQANVAVPWVTFQSAKSMSFLQECSRSWRETEATNRVYRPLLEQPPVAIDSRSSLEQATAVYCVAWPCRQGPSPPTRPGRQLSTWTLDH